jgi:hypothetical protein
VGVHFEPSVPFAAAVLGEPSYPASNATNYLQKLQGQEEAERPSPLLLKHGLFGVALHDELGDSM